MFRKKRKKSTIFLPNKRTITARKQTKRGFFASISRLLRAKSSKSKKFLRITAITCLFLLIGFVIFSVFFSGFFSIQSIHIQRGDTQVDRNKIQKSLTPLLDQNLLFVSSEDIIKTIRKNFPNIAEVGVMRKLPNVLQISVKSYPPAANIKYISHEAIPGNDGRPNEQKCLINSQGYIIDIGKEDPQFPVIELKERKKRVQLHENVIDAEVLAEIMHSLHLLQEYFHESTKYIEYYKNGREYHLIIQNGTSLWLDFSNPPEEQLLKIKKIIPELNILENPVEYVDLRIKDKLIYK